MENSQPAVHETPSSRSTRDGMELPISIPPPPSLHRSTPGSRDTTTTREPWNRSYLHYVLKSKDIILFVFMLISCVILTIFARSGELIFNDQPISWKIILYNIVLEAMYLVVVSDLLSVVIDYFLTREGLTLPQIGHALRTITQIRFSAANISYLACYLVISVGFALVPPILLSVVLLRTTDNTPHLVRAEDRYVSTNALGGKSGNNFGMTGHLFLFTSAREKFNFNENRQQYVVYERPGLTSTVFIPKTPQVGTYADDVNSPDGEGSDIYRARVRDVQGLLYECSPTVREDSRRIEDYPIINDDLRGDFFKFLEEEMAPETPGDDKKARLNLTIAIKKGPESTAVLTIPCRATAARGDLNITREEDGFMSMAVDNLKELSLKLPGRVLGLNDSVLNVAVENAVSALGINVVTKYVANDRSLKDWDGLIRCLVGAYGIRSAIHDTFADRDDKRLATNVMVMGEVKTQPENLRTIIIWIPFILVCVSGMTKLAFPSVLIGDLTQVLQWMSPFWTEPGGDFPPGDENTRFFLSLREIHGNWQLRFTNMRDLRLGVGSMRRIRRFIEGLTTGSAG